MKEFKELEEDHYCFESFSSIKRWKPHTTNMDFHHTLSLTFNFQQNFKSAETYRLGADKQGEEEAWTSSPPPPHQSNVTPRYGWPKSRKRKSSLCNRWCRFIGLFELTAPPEWPKCFGFVAVFTNTFFWWSWQVWTDSASFLRLTWLHVCVSKGQILSVGHLFLSMPADC